MRASFLLLPGGDFAPREDGLPRRSQSRYLSLVLTARAGGRTIRLAVAPVLFVQRSRGGLCHCRGSRSQIPTRGWPEAKRSLLRTLSTNPAQCHVPVGHWGPGLLGIAQVSSDKAAIKDA